LFSSDLPLHGLWSYGRVWRVAFASLTHNRLTTVARLLDHSNSLLRVLSTRQNAAPRLCALRIGPDRLVFTEHSPNNMDSFVRCAVRRAGVY